MNTEKIYEEYLLQMLKEKAEYQASEACDSPSANYFWYRKRKQVVKLLKNNLQSIQQIRNNRKENQLFVELGSGEGTDLFLIHKTLHKESDDWKLIGLEGDSLHSKICEYKKNSSKVGNEIEFQCIDLTDVLPFTNQEVDVVYCSEVIEHMPNPEDLFIEVKRVLKPGGYLLMTTPNQPNILQRSYWDEKRNAQNQQYLKSIEPEIKIVEGKEIKIYGHISLKTNAEWDSVLKNIGFNLVDYERGALFYGGAPFYDQELMLGVSFIIQAILDILPKKLVRNISDQLIALYKKDV